MENASQLINVFIYLLAAVLAVPGARRLGLGPVLGYLVAGVFIGPWGLALIREAADIDLLASFGTSILMFLIGFQLQPRLLMKMQQSILYKGCAQWVTTVILFFMIGMTAGLLWPQALAIAVALALSSNSLIDHFVGAKNLSDTEQGVVLQASLLAQSLIVFPLLVFLPLLGFGSALQDNPGILGVAQVLLTVAVILVAGHTVLRHVLRYISATQLPDMFIAFTLVLVIGVVLLLQISGASMWLGAFVAGCLMAASEFRRQLESSIEPFRDLLLGLFFIAMGLMVDFGLLLQYPLIALAVLLVMVVLKFFVVAAFGYLATGNSRQSWLPAVLLAPAGELSVVVLGVAMTYQAIDTELGSGMIVVVALSMLITPILQVIYSRHVGRRLILESENLDEVPAGGIMIAGFGRVGQVVGRMVKSASLNATVIDHDPVRLQGIQKYGFRVHCGDALRLDLLELAGLARARVLVIAIDDHDRIVSLATMVKLKYPHVSVVTRSRDRLQQVELVSHGVEKTHRETFEGAILMGEDALNSVGVDADETERVSEAFRDHDERLINQEIDFAIDQALEARDGEVQSDSARTLLASDHTHGRNTLEGLLERDQQEYEKERAMKLAGD